MSVSGSPMLSSDAYLSTPSCGDLSSKDDYAQTLCLMTPHRNRNLPLVISNPHDSSTPLHLRHRQDSADLNGCLNRQLHQSLQLISDC